MRVKLLAGGKLGAGNLERAVLLLPEKFVDSLSLALEGDEVVSLQHPAGRQAHAHRVDLGAVDHQLVMEVRAGGEARLAEIADDLSLAHPDAGCDSLGERGLVI